MSLDVWGARGKTRYLGAEYTVLFTDKNLNVLGDPVAHWNSVQVTLRWKEPGSGQIEMPAHAYIRAQLVPGARVVILRRLFDMQHTLIAGPVESWLRERADDGDNGGVGKLTVTFVDDLAWLGARIAYPNPALAASAQTSDYWTFTGNPVSAMEQLVNANAGPSALSERRVPNLIINTPSPAVTDIVDVTIKARLDKLTDVLRTICARGVGPNSHRDSLGFRTRQVGTQIYFEPVRSRQLGGQVHFSFAAGNLKYYSFEQKAPSITHPHVGGQGEGVDRFFDVYPTTDAGNLAWGRFESYVPYAGNAPVTELRDQATQTLNEQGQNARLASNASDTPDQRFGVHYNIGDVVGLELDVGIFVTAPVQTINVQMFPTAGEVAGITIGDQGARYDSDWIRRVRDMDRRVGYLERVTLPRAV